MPAPPICETARVTGPRRISWSRKEVENLLDLWGEEKMQTALKLNHRNIDYYESIAAEMYARGFNRTAVECRNKAKLMRLEYRRVAEANSRSGAGHASCSFYEDLHRILGGDASVHPRRVARSMSISRNVPPKDAARRTVAEGSEELFSHDLATMNPQDIVDRNASLSGEWNMFVLLPQY